MMLNNKYTASYFDESGKLLWPKQMAHEDVKKLVAEREHNKDKEQ